MITVLFHIESHYPVKRSVIREAIVDHLKGKVKSDAEVSVSIVGNRKMHGLNKTYRNLDKTTDVLSFPMAESSRPDVAYVMPPDGILRLGDIIVSYPMAVQSAMDENKLVDVMIVELVLHGLDHLLGIHHPE